VSAFNGTLMVMELYKAKAEGGGTSQGGKRQAG